MRIAIINETSAADRHGDILAALEGRGHEIINAGMTKSGASPELTYIHTGLLSALLLNAERVERVVGGCGTGQGYLNSVMLYPQITCGHLLTPLDAWLFAQINDGNCISLALNQGYGWGSNVNLRMLFDAYFSVAPGGGYPPAREASQRESRARLARISRQTHQTMAAIVREIDDEILLPALRFPGIWQLLDVATMADRDLAQALTMRFDKR